MSSEPHTDPPETVRDFLASLQPPLDGLTAVFVQGGIHDKTALDTFISMTEKQQRCILEKLPLTTFQVQVICNGLELR